MKKIIGTVLVLGFMSGCLVTTRGGGHRHRGNDSSARRSQSCPPSQHWNGYQCEHNGRARGHDKRR